MITNQSGINRGLYTYKNFIDLSFYIHNELWNNELEIEINFQHAPEEECKCRKPKTGMLDRYNIGRRDIFIGDKDTDMMTAYSKGIPHRWLINPNQLNCPYPSIRNHEELKREVSMLR